MFCTSLKHILLIGVTLASFTAIAGEEGGEAAPAAKEKEKKEKPTAAMEYVKVQTKLNTIESRVTDAENDFRKLVEKKENTKDQKQVEEILKEMVEVTKQRNKDAEELRRVQTDFLYRYPSKSVELNRLYQIEEKKTVEEMTSGADLDEMLTRIKKVIERKFAPFNPEPEKKTVTAKPEEEEPKPKLRLEK